MSDRQPISPQEREKIGDALTIVIQSWDHCATCGDLNEDAHDSHPHPYRAVDVVALFLEELNGVGLTVAALAAPPALSENVAQPREEEEPFSEGFWAGRSSDRAKDTYVERERAYQAYRAGERLNRADGNRTPLQDRVAALAAPPEGWQGPKVGDVVRVRGLSFPQKVIEIVGGHRVRVRLDGISDCDGDGNPTLVTLKEIIPLAASGSGETEA